MPVVANHPVRLRRIQAGLSQQQLAVLAGVTRGTVAQIEEGRTRKLNAKVAHALVERTGESVEVLLAAVDAWKAQDVMLELTQRGRNTLLLPPTVVKLYDSFQMWREDVSPNRTSFSTLMRMPRSTLVSYESGRTSEFPKPLIEGLATHLRCSDEYIEAVMGLPVD